MYIRQREPAKIVSKEWKLTIVFLRGLNVVSPDGNGRVGRMIILKQCLDNNIIPIIIRDDNKAEYYRSLNKAQHANDYSSLVKYFQKEQKYYVDNTEKMLFAYEELEK